MPGLHAGLAAGGRERDFADIGRGDRDRGDRRRGYGFGDGAYEDDRRGGGGGGFEERRGGRGFADTYGPRPRPARRVRLMRLQGAAH